MRCSEIREHLSSYMDGMLPAEEMQAVAEHLSLCPDCREELRQLEETVSLLRNLGEVEPPADLRESIINSIQASANRGRWTHSIGNWFRKGSPWGGLVAVAVCFLFLAVIFQGGLFPQKETDAVPGETAGPNMGEYFAAEMQDAEKSAGLENFAVDEEGIPDSPRTMVAVEPEVERKVIKRAHLSIVVEDLDKDFAQIIAMVEEAGGFVQNSNTWENEVQRASHITVRVPVDNFFQLLAQVEAMGRVDSRELEGQDVTTEYVDIEARLRNLKRQEERFLEILDQAETVEDILNIERELERVRGEIESLTAQLKNLEDLTTLSTINLELKQLKVSAERIDPPGWQGVFAQAYQAAISTVNSILNFLGEVVIFIGRILPILPLGLLAWLGYRKQRKGKGKL